MAHGALALRLRARNGGPTSNRKKQTKKTKKNAPVCGIAHSPQRQEQSHTFGSRNQSKHLISRVVYVCGIGGVIHLSRLFPWGRMTREGGEKPKKKNKMKDERPPTTGLQPCQHTMLHFFFFSRSCRLFLTIIAIRLITYNYYTLFRPSVALPLFHTHGPHTIHIAIARRRRRRSKAAPGPLPPPRLAHCEGCVCVCGWYGFDGGR